MKRIVEIMLAGYLVSVEVELLSEFGLPDEYRVKLVDVVDLHKNGDKTNSLDQLMNDPEYFSALSEKAIDEFRASL